MNQKKTAARILKCGKSRVWFDPSRPGDIDEAITAQDMRRLKKDGVIRKKPKKGISNYRKKKVAEQKRKGRRKGRGSYKGSLGTRAPRKKLWISRIRAIRRLLRELKKEDKIENSVYRDMYRKSEGGFFRSKSHIMIYLERNGLLKEKR